MQQGRQQGIYNSSFGISYFKQTNSKNITNKMLKSHQKELAYTQIAPACQMMLFDFIIQTHCLQHLKDLTKGLLVLHWQSSHKFTRILPTLTAGFVSLPYTDSMPYLLCFQKTAFEAKHREKYIETEPLITFMRFHF